MFNVLCDDAAPTVTGGYAKITTLDRSERAGLSVFTGYDPSGMELAIRFESTDSRGSFHGADGSLIERDITLLEQMAGRGQIAGAAVGAPPLVRVTTTDVRGHTVPLIPLNYQRTSGNPNGPIWWIAGIDWDKNPARNFHGERIRQLATVTLLQYVAPDALTSVSDRAKSKKKTKK